MTRRRLLRSVAIWCLCCVLACGVTGLPVTADSSGRVVQACVLLVVGLLADPAVAGRGAWMVEALEAIALLAVLGMIGAVSSYLTLWYAGALADPMLDRADRWLGFDWVWLREEVAARPRLLSLLERAYLACFWLPPAIILLLCASGRTARVHHLLSAFGTAILLGLPLFFLMPAVAAFDFYDQVPLPANAQHYGTLIAALHTHRLQAIDLNDLGGIVSFPSFHATMAILFAWALWPFRTLRAVSLPLTATMGLAAIPVGGHYLVDVIGGSLVAVAALVLTAAPVKTLAPSRLRLVVGLAPQRG